MENYGIVNFIVGIIKKSLKLTRWMLAAGLVLLTATESIAAVAPSCAAIFPQALQSHNTDGEISFEWNAQLLKSTSTSLTAQRVNNAWSMLASCGAVSCTSDGKTAAELSLEFLTSSGTVDRSLGYKVTETYGSASNNNLRNIDVGTESVLTLTKISTAYRIKSLKLGYAATLNLPAGYYWIENLTLDSATVINVIGEGTAHIFVKNNITFPWKNFINMQASGAPLSAAKLFIYSEGDIALQTDAEVSAVIYAKKRFSLAQAKFYGASSFGQANLAALSQANYQKDALATIDLASVCNLPNVQTSTEPTTPTLPTTPSDNSCSAIFSNGLQTFGNNGAVIFQYNAQLHNASSTRLSTASIQLNNGGSTQLSCVNSQCTASGISVVSLGARTFKQTISTTNITVPWMSNATIGDSSHLEYGSIVISSLASVNFNAQSSAYRIKELNMAYSSTLRLPAGDYWIEKLSLSSESHIEVIGAGTVRLFIKTATAVPWMTTINTNTQDASKFIIYSFSDVELQTGASAYALVYSEAQVKLAYQAKLYGGITANKIILETDSHVTYKNDAVALAKFGEICNGNNVQPDLVPPVIVITSSVISPDATTSTIAGTVTDPVQAGSGIATVTATNTQGQIFSAILNGNNFSIIVPLTLGDNVFNVQAKDFSNNVSSQSVSIKRTSLPQFQNVLPANGSVFSTRAIALTGEARTAWPQANVKVELNNVVQSLVAAGEGVYRFSVNVTLQPGANSFVLRATTPDGAADTTLNLTYTNLDRDGDGHPDVSDAFPDDPNEWSDLDKDGIGDNSDPDRDGDGISNEYETQAGTNPNDATSVPPDRDHDGIPDSLDNDRDGDGHPNNQDAFPDDPAEWSDLDKDGIGDNSDPDRDGDGFTNLAETQAGTNPDDPLDYPDKVAPLVQILNPQNEKVNSATLVLRGNASDPVQAYSGIAAVKIRSDKYPAINLVAALTGDLFEASVPLMLGENNLTVTVTDNSGNRTDANHKVWRISAPQLSGITPANNSVITADKVTIAGQVLTQLPLEEVRFYINDWQVTPSGTGTVGIYAFNLKDVPLQLGQNTFSLRVVTADGADESQLILTRSLGNPNGFPAPEVSILAPVSGSQLRESSFRLKGHVVSQAGKVRVTINGQPANISSFSGEDTYFDAYLSFAEGQDNLAVVIDAADSLDKHSHLTASYSHDGSAPIIRVQGGIQPTPVINPVVQSPFTLSGTIEDANLASMTLNDQAIQLQPDSVAGRYSFSVLVKLEPGEQTQLALSAYDLSGNHTSVEYGFKSTAQASISPLLPGDAAEFISTGEPLIIQVAARLTGARADSTAIVAIGSAQTQLTLAGTLASGDITLPTAAGDYLLSYTLLDNAHQVIASSTRNIRILSEQAVAVELLRHVPDLNAVNIETNQPVELYFNKTVDPAKISIVVRETLHGNTYLNLDDAGTDFLHAQGYQLQQVHRDNEIVAGGISVLPGNQNFAFYPNRQFGYNADIYVEVNYDNKELSRFNFKVRPLPTFLTGAVADQFGQPLTGVKVTLAASNRSTMTNKDGGFAFGFQEQAGSEIPAGRYKLTINPDLSLVGYGTQVRTVTLQAGRKNELGLLRLTELSPDVPFQLISGGDANVSLAGNDLRLNLSSARLLFNDGRTSGNIQAQFMPYEQLGSAITPGAWPQWMFAVQPRGVSVEGTVGIDIKMPALRGSYDYLPNDMAYVVLLGYNAEREVIEPIGIGKVENYRITSVGKVKLHALDYIGYAIVKPAQQSLLKEVADGNQTLQQLMAVLQQ